MTQSAGFYSSLTNKDNLKVNWGANSRRIAEPERLMMERVEGWCWDIFRQCVPHPGGGSRKCLATDIVDSVNEGISRWLVTADRLRAGTQNLDPKLIHSRTNSDSNSVDIEVAFFTQAAIKSHYLLINWLGLLRLVLNTALVTDCVRRPV